jgi:hypothetical protein
MSRIISLTIEIVKLHTDMPSWNVHQIAEHLHCDTADAQFVVSRYDQCAEEARQRKIAEQILRQQYH